MRLTRLLKPVNWRYAIGEIVLISIGVLVALAAADWQNDREARQAEVAVLMQISESLAQDRESLVRWCEFMQKKKTKLEQLQAHLQARQPYSKSLDSLFGSLYGYIGPPLNRAAFESLKSQGMELISDFSLQNQIGAMYENTYWYIEHSFSLSRETTLDLLRPYYLRNFSEIKFHESATPIDYDNVKSDITFRNLLDYRLTQIRGPHLSICGSAPRKMEILIEAIATHIE